MATEVAKRGLFVGVDGSPSAKVAVDWAAREAGSRNLPLTLVHVSGPPVLTMWPEVPMPPEYARWQEDQGRKILDAASNVAEAGRRGIPVVCRSSPRCRRGPDVGHSRGSDPGRRTGGGGLPRTRRTGPWPARFGQLRFGAPRACPVAVIHDEDPLMDKPARGARSGRHRRVAGVGVGRRHRVRRGVATWCRTRRGTSRSAMPTSRRCPESTTSRWRGGGCTKSSVSGWPAAGALSGRQSEPGGDVGPAGECCWSNGRKRPSCWSSAVTGAAPSQALLLGSVSSAVAQPRLACR